MKKISITLLVVLLGGITICVAGGEVLAYEIENLPNTAVEGDVMVGPGKVEISLDPGGSYERNIYFTNRTGRTVNFTVDAEDFKGSRDANKGTIFLGDQKGPYSLKDYLHPDAWTFTLEHGQRIVMPVKIEIPQDAEPGGLYGVVFATAEPARTEPAADGETAATKINIATRVGCLFFVKVNGDIREEGELANFSTVGNKSYFEKGPINFQFTYVNNGSAHLVPYGIIEIMNPLGRKVDQIEVSPYFAMPDAERLNEIKWDRGALFGRYTAILSLNRGYGDIIDSKQISFWVFPWKLMLAGLAGLIAIVWFFGWVLSHFEFKKKE